jgi:hypothetical protein
MRLNRVKSNSSGQRRTAFAPTHDVVHVVTPAHATGRPGTTAGAPLRPPVPRLRTDVHTQTLVATRSTFSGRANQWSHRRTSPALPRTSPYVRRAAPRLPLAVAPRTALVPYRDPLPKARAPIKGVELAAACIAPGTEPPSRHCRRQWCPRRAPPSGRLQRQHVLLLPALGLLVAFPFACCPGQAASSPE